MTELKCKNCGASLDVHTLKCDYCGTQYKEERRLDNVMHYIQTCEPKIKPLRYQMSISEAQMMHMPPEMLSEISIREITRELAKELIPFVKIETERDIRSMKQIIRGTVRVVEPDFRF